MNVYIQYRSRSTPVAAADAGERVLGPRQRLLARHRLRRRRRRRARRDRHAHVRLEGARSDGRIVAAGGHLHGGAKDMWLSQPRCGEPAAARHHARVRDARPPRLPRPADPARAGADRHALVLLRDAASDVRKGETLRLSATYDATLPHTVMSIMHIYVAPPRKGAPKGCARAAGDRQRAPQARPLPPRPAAGHGAAERHRRRRAHVRDHRPAVAGAARSATAALIDIGRRGYRPQAVELPVGSSLTWRVKGSHGAQRPLRQRPAADQHGVAAQRRDGQPPLPRAGALRAVLLAAPGDDAPDRRSPLSDVRRRRCRLRRRRLRRRRLGTLDGRRPPAGRQRRGAARVRRAARDRARVVPVQAQPPRARPLRPHARAAASARSHSAPSTSRGGRGLAAAAERGRPPAGCATRAERSELVPADVALGVDERLAEQDLVLGDQLHPAEAAGLERAATSASCRRSSSWRRTRRGSRGPRGSTASPSSTTPASM